MKNSLISIFIFLVLISFLFYSDMKFKNLCTETINDCEFLEYGLSSENKEESFEAAMIILAVLMKKLLFLQFILIILIMTCY